MSRFRRTRSASVAAAAALALTLAGPPTTAHAGLIDGLLGTVVGVVSGTTQLLSGTVASLLGPTGWIVEDGQTDLDHVATVIGATSMYQRGYDGRGVGVALIDTGVAPVKGLTSGNVVNGPDLSFESQSDIPLPGHVRPRHAHGRDHRGQRPAHPARRRPLPGHRPRCAAHQRQGGQRRRRRRRLAGRRSDRLGRAAPQRRPAQPDPRPQPVLRNRRDPGLPAGPAHARRRERLAGRHRRRGRRRQRGRGAAEPQQPGVRPVRARRRRFGHPRTDRRFRRPRTRLQQPRQREPAGRPGGARPVDRVAARPRRLPRRRRTRAHASAPASSRAAARPRPPPWCPGRSRCSWTAARTSLPTR